MFHGDGEPCGGAMPVGAQACVIGVEGVNVETTWPLDPLITKERSNYLGRKSRVLRDPKTRTLSRFREKEKQ